MRKTDSNFKMPNEYKTMIRMFKGNETQRNLWKKSFIEAAVAVEDHRKSKISKDKGE
jgi:hypothetical protein